MNLYYEFALLLLVATVIGAIALRFRQPLIVAYIVVGIALGPSGLDWVTAYQEVNPLAQIGVTVLLFVVGLKLDLTTVKSVGPVALATGIGQLAFTTLIGFAIAIALGMTPLVALYVAVALTFTSTIIIVKLLSDKREVDSLHGCIAIGFLIVQDIAVLVAMLLLGSYRTDGDANLWRTGKFISDHGWQGRVLPMVHRGDPARTIIDQASALHADLIVMGKRERPRLEQMLLGSVTESVLVDLATDLLLVID